nr:transposase [Acidianus brierleyi]
MERKIKPKVFAIDVGESRLVATKMEINNNTVKEADTREFKYNEEGLKELIKFLEGYEEGIMEATGVYFYHVYNVLRDNGLKVNVINPVQTVEVLGKKTDKNDSIRLAIAYAAGTVKGSYQREKCKN